MYCSSQIEMRIYEFYKTVQTILKEIIAEHYSNPMTKFYALIQHALNTIKYICKKKPTHNKIAWFNLENNIFFKAM